MLDQRSLSILDILQTNADTPVSDIADRVSLSVSACSRRIAQLQASGYVERRVAILDRRKMGVPTTVFVMVKAGRHVVDWIESFRSAISTIPEIQEVHRLTGTYDYIMKVVLPNVESYDHVYKRLVSRIEPFEISAYISMEALKSGTSLPMNYT